MLSKAYYVRQPNNPKFRSRHANCSYCLSPVKSKDDLQEESASLFNPTRHVFAKKEPKIPDYVTLGRYFRFAMSQGTSQKLLSKVTITRWRNELLASKPKKARSYLSGKWTWMGERDVAILSQFKAVVTRLKSQSQSVFTTRFA